MSGQQGQDDKHSMQILWIIAGIFILGAFIWWGFKEQLKAAFIFIRLAEIWLINLVVQFIPVPAMQNEVAEALEVAKILKHNMLSLPVAEELSLVVGKYLKFPFLLGLAWCSYTMYGKNIKMRYKKRYDMKRLAAQECTEWPQINPVMGLNLVKADIDKGPWAMALTPLAFCKKYKLITVSIAPSATVLQQSENYNVELDKQKASRVFSQQLGQLWRSPEKMPMYKQALLACFIARGARDTDAARALLTQINCSANGNAKKQQLNFEGAQKLWRKHYNTKPIQLVVQRHAYEYTVFTGLFLLAREDGVFATADFLWLKPLDRRLWYVLNNVGRQTPYCEGAGVHAHFLAESALKRALGVPMIEQAVNGLQLALNEIKYVADLDEREELIKAYNEKMKANN